MKIPKHIATHGSSRLGADVKWPSPWAWCLTSWISLSALINLRARPESLDRAGESRQDDVTLGRTPEASTHRESHAGRGHPLALDHCSMVNLPLDHLESKSYHIAPAAAVEALLPPVCCSKLRCWLRIPAAEPGAGDATAAACWVYVVGSPNTGAWVGASAGAGD